MNRARSILVIGCAFASFLLTATAGTAGSRQLEATVCPKLNGPHWFFSASTGGTKYSLETSGGFSCSTAATWVKKLAAVTLPSSKQNVHYTIAGPAGFSCEASPDKYRHAFTGSCEKLVKSSPVKLGFVWTSSFF